MNPEPPALDAAAVAALADEPIDWRFKGLPATWWGRTPAQLRSQPPHLFDAGAVAPVAVLRAAPLTHNLEAMADWCRRRGVQLAPHGKTHMAPQLFARQLAAGACAITVANISQVRVCRAFGVREVILANQLVDAAALAWVAAELAADPAFRLVCWVDSVAGVDQMARALAAAGAVRPVEVCVEVGLPGGRTGCRADDTVDAVARAAAATPQLRLVGVAGYEAALGHDVSTDGLAAVTAYLRRLRATVLRLAALFETDRVVVTAGGSTYFDAVAEVLGGDWPDAIAVQPVLRSGAYLTHDHGLYARTSPMQRGDGEPSFQPALQVWTQVLSRPEPELAVLTMGRRDVSFDQDLPVPLTLTDSAVTKLNDQHAYLRVGAADREQVAVGDWLGFGISHPCTVFDKWQLIPVLDEDDRVVELIRTFF